MIQSYRTLIELVQDEAEKEASKVNYLFRCVRHEKMKCTNCLIFKLISNCLTSWVWARALLLEE